MSHRVVIVGGGLSGLHAAALLQAANIHDYVLLEAQAGFGGRIRSGPTPVALPASGIEPPGSNPFDLGATWFWPALQPELAGLIDALQLTSFPQRERGDMLIERSVSGGPLRMAGLASSPQGMRLHGGMATLVDALLRRLAVGNLCLGTRVTHVRLHGPVIEVEVLDATGDRRTWQADHVLLALPPRLAVSTIAFTPELPAELARQWQQTPTWMAPHAKFLAVYDEPFWRARGLSGEARSSVGPLAEIHDASSAEGPAALFGFLGIPAQVRAQLTEPALRELCRHQLVRLFGAAAARPRAEWFKDWATDCHTASPADLQAESQHAFAPAASAASGPWRDRLVGIASEWSREFPGYVAGAVEASRTGVAVTTGASADIVGAHAHVMVDQATGGMP